MEWTTSDQRRLWAATPDEVSETMQPVLKERFGDNPTPDVSRAARTAVIFESAVARGGVIWYGLPVIVAWLAMQALAAFHARRRTPGFWFWVSFLPLGAGLLWFVCSELLHVGRPPRSWRTGWAGLGLFLLAGALGLR